MACRFGAELVAVHVISDKPLSDAERRMAEVEFQSEGAKDFILRPSTGAASDTRLQTQQLVEQAAETRGRLLWLWGSALRAMPVHAPTKRPFRPFVRSREWAIRQRRS